MNKSEENISKTSQKALTRQILLDSLLGSLENSEESNKQDDKTRDLNHIRPVVNLLFHRQWEIPKTVKDKSIHRINEVSNFIEKAALFGYTFFLQSSPQCCYNWSYLRKKIDSYKDFLITFQDFLDLVICDINKEFTNILGNKTDITLIINEYLIIKHRCQKPHFDAKLKIEKIDLIRSTKKDEYNLKILLGATTIAVFTRRKDSNLCEIIKRTEKAINQKDRKGIQNEK